ncbi:hypothetical protein VTO42DRAFT_1699 [Malbranchea cinnamomea]
MGAQSPANQKCPDQQVELPTPPELEEGSKGSETLVNASGHKQELDRQFNLLSICAIGITTGNTWIAMGGSLTTAIFNGGPPGVIYEFIAVAICYWFVSASIAELASAIPSAAGVYHWASVTAGKYGREVGFFAGFWNCLAWIFGAASMSLILGNQTVAMYMLFHPELEAQAWHIFVSYIICTWLCCSIVLFANKALPSILNLGLFFIVAGVFITIIVCAVMPHVNGVGYASHSFVWRDWTNNTGWSSNGFVFVLGMLNGAYSCGTSDVTSHMAEEIPRPSKNVPKAILAQMTAGFITAIPYMITLLYAINDLDAILSSNSTFPLAPIYHQATGTRGGALGLLILAFIPTFLTCTGCYLTCGRTLWTLARDNATPFAGWLARVSKRMHNPFNATLVCGVFITILGCIYVGSSTAFQAFIGSYIQLSTLSYLAAILPHLLRKRKSFHPGWFFMHGPLGFFVNAFSCGYIITFIVIFCFPFAMPTDAKSMNYASLMTGGLTIFVAVWFFFRRKSYQGTKAVPIGDALVSAHAI